MTWHFDIKDHCNMMMVVVAEPGPHEEHTFLNDGKYDPVDDAPGIIKSHHVSALVSGSSTTTLPGWGSYESVDFEHDSPQWPGKQTGPFSEEAYAKAGEAGCTYVCFTARPNVKLDYEVFVGPHEFRAGERDTCAVVVRGNACIGGIGECEKWKIVDLVPRFISNVEADEDAITFYLWDRSE